MVANQRDLQEIASLATTLTRQVQKLVSILEDLEFRVAALEKKARE